MYAYLTGENDEPQSDRATSRAAAAAVNADAAASDADTDDEGCSGYWTSDKRSVSSACCERYATSQLAIPVRLSPKYGYFHLELDAFSALTLLVWRQVEHPA